MIFAAATTLSTFSPSSKDSFLPLLPSLDEAQAVAKEIAAAVANVAIAEGLAQIEEGTDIEQSIRNRFWEARYLPFRKK
jgi:malate dehydrogenase (oxaloacetate-decarboxylating)